MGPAGVELSNENNGLCVPTDQNRGIENKDEFGHFPNPPNRPSIADTPPGRWWTLGVEYPPEADSPLLDAWLSTNDPTAWIGLLGGETIDG